MWEFDNAGAISETPAAFAATWPMASNNSPLEVSVPAAVVWDLKTGV